jgi:tRNA dimethylallyltransferase
LSIGTAKPTKEEQKGIQHYFIDSHSISDEVTASTYAKEALFILETEFKNHDFIIMVGGSGMFIDAVCNGLDDIPASIDLRNELTQLVNENGLEGLLIELKEKDFEFYEIVDKQNPVRVIRAIEAIRLSNMTFSEMRKNQKVIRPFIIKRYIINHEREKLYERINFRVDIMMEQGLLIEVQNLIPYKNLSSLKTVGYSELFRFLDKEIDLQEAIELIKQNSRRYAKRQLTWFRKHEDAVWIPFNPVEQMMNEINKDLTIN